MVMDVRWKHSRHVGMARPCSYTRVEGRHDDPNESLPSPTTAVERLQKWNRPRVNLFRSFAAFWAFTVMGMNDAAYGVCAMTLQWIIC